MTDPDLGSLQKQFHPYHPPVLVRDAAPVPLALLFSGASFDALKQVAILVSTPLGLVLLLMVFGLLRWMKEDRKKAGMLLLVKDDMDEMIRLSRVEEPEDDASSPLDPVA